LTISPICIRAGQQFGPFRLSDFRAIFQTREAPGGIDAYFNHVGGDTRAAALSVLRVHGRIIACGGISGDNGAESRPGPSNLFTIITKRLTMKDLIVSDWLDRQAEFEKEVGGYFKAGKLKNRETVAKGIDHAVHKADSGSCTGGSPDDGCGPLLGGKRGNRAGAVNPVIVLWGFCEGSLTGNPRKLLKKWYARGDSNA
jgi:hypothetical protein